jgi:hypothetical protein
MAMGSLMGLGHEAHHRLLGLVRSKHDARFRGRHEHLGVLCTKAPARWRYMTTTRTEARMSPKKGAKLPLTNPIIYITKYRP